MHRQWIGLVGAAVLGVVAMVAWDADAARQATAPTVVGTVDLTKVLNALDEWQAELDRSEEAAKSFQAEYQKRREVIVDLEADREDFVPGTEKYAEAEHRLKKAIIDNEGYLGLSQRREARTKQRAVLRIYNHIRESTGTLADQNGYGLIILDDSAIEIQADSADVLGDISARRVLFASPTIDVTDELIELMNAQWQDARGG